VQDDRSDFTPCANSLRSSTRDFITRQRDLEELSGLFSATQYGMRANAVQSSWEEVCEGHSGEVKGRGWICFWFQDAARGVREDSLRCEEFEAADSLRCEGLRLRRV